MERHLFNELMQRSVWMEKATRQKIKPRNLFISMWLYSPCKQLEMLFHGLVAWNSLTQAEWPLHKQEYSQMRWYCWVLGWIIWWFCQWEKRDFIIRSRKMWFVWSELKSALVCYGNAYMNAYRIKLISILEAHRIYQASKQTYGVCIRI